MKAVSENKWLTIESYRDFHDIPHVIIVRDVARSRWLFDNRFNDEANGYEPFFGVGELPRGVEIEEIWRRFSQGEFALEAQIELRRIEFDVTRRSALRLVPA